MSRFWAFIRIVNHSATWWQFWIRNISSNWLGDYSFDCTWPWINFEQFPSIWAGKCKNLLCYMCQIINWIQLKRNISNYKQFVKCLFLFYFSFSDSIEPVYSPHFITYRFVRWLSDIDVCLLMWFLCNEFHDVVDTVSAGSIQFN